MSSEKKDLTRIEDLGEFLHDLNDDGSSFEPPEELPSEENSDSPDFESSEDFMTEESPLSSENESGDFSLQDESSTESSETSDFNSNEETFVPQDEITFGNESDLTGDAPQAQEDLAPQREDLSTFSTFEEPTQEMELIPEAAPVFEAPIEEKSFKQPETFEDIKRFAESTSYSGMGAEGNPSFSLLLKNVRFIEDVTEITETLKELGLLSDSEEQTKARLMRGHLLVPRISEYAAIFLAHKLRRFDIDIQVGLSDEIHPPKHQELPETGVVSRRSLYQNQTHHFSFDDPKLELSHIIVAATSNLEGHQIVRYLGVASEHKMLDGLVVEDEGSQEIPRHYAELAQKLKAHALKAHANAIVGLNYQLTPLPSEFGLTSSRYRLSCTGNLVWVNKL